MRLILFLLLVTPIFAQSALLAPEAVDQAAMDRDLMEVTVDGLHGLYRDHHYTVTQVVRWHLDRIARYDGIYRAVQTVRDQAALADAAREDSEAAKPGDKFVVSFGTNSPYDKETFIRHEVSGEIDPTVSQTLTDETVVIDQDTAETPFTGDK